MEVSSGHSTSLGSASSGLPDAYLRRTAGRLRSEAPGGMRAVECVAPMGAACGAVQDECLPEEAVPILLQ